MKLACTLLLLTACASAPANRKTTLPEPTSLQSTWRFGQCRLEVEGVVGRFGYTYHIGEYSQKKTFDLLFDDEKPIGIFCGSGITRILTRNMVIRIPGALELSKEPEVNRFELIFNSVEVSVKAGFTDHHLSENGAILFYPDGKLVRYHEDLVDGTYGTYSATVSLVDFNGGRVRIFSDKEKAVVLLDGTSRYYLVDFESDAKGVFASEFKEKFEPGMEVRFDSREIIVEREGIDMGKL